jgi:DNA-binding transcriptional LysR family regulator
MSGTVAGDMRVGVPFHEGPPLLAPALTRVRRAHPGLRITLHGLPATESRQAVRLGQLDLAMVARYDHVPEPQVPGTHEELVVSDRLRLAVHCDHPLAGRGPQPLTAFSDDQWILSRGSTLGQAAFHACGSVGFAPDVVADSGDMQAALALVALGWGVALVPDLVPDRPGHPVARIALDGTPLTRHVSLVVRRGALARPATSVVIEAIRATAREVTG